MRPARWELFFKEKVTKIFSEKKSIIDIGGGLRISRRQGNRYDPTRAWIEPLVAAVNYQILDPVGDYHPDIVGDIHHLPFTDSSQEALICLAVLEHVEDPRQAMSEMLRVLQPGGYCFIYVPFLYYYHAERGYYHDYWRFTHDALALLGQGFTAVELSAVRGALETWLHISPLGRQRWLVHVFRWLDGLTGKSASNQVSGYYVFLVK